MVCNKIKNFALKVVFVYGFLIQIVCSMEVDSQAESSIPPVGRWFILPQEVYPLIACHVSHLKDYQSVAQTCKLFNQVFAPEILKAYCQKPICLNLNTSSSLEFGKKIMSFAKQNKIQISLKLIGVFSRDMFEKLMLEILTSQIVRSLDVSDNKIDGNKFEVFVRASQSSPAQCYGSLQSLNLSSCHLSEEDIQVLTQKISFETGGHVLFPNLENLDLSKNGFGSDGINALVKASHHFPVLKHLDVSETAMDISGLSVVLKSSLKLSLKSVKAKHNYILVTQAKEEINRHGGKTISFDLTGNISQRNTLISYAQE